MMPKFDIFIPCAQKDYHKLPYVIGSIKKNIEFDGMIHVSIPFEIEQWVYSDIIFHRDIDVLNVDKTKWKFRPSWMYQQCLKLFQEVTQDLFLCVDCDTIFNKPVTFFEGNKKVWHTGWKQYNPPYFSFQEQMIGMGKEIPESAISDTGFYDRQIIKQILKVNNYQDKFDFIRKAQSITTDKCYMCEQDLYATYCFKQRDDYVFKPLNMRGPLGLVQTDPAAISWTKEEIEKQIEEMKSTDYQTFSLHSWYNEDPLQLVGKDRRP